MPHVFEAMRARLNSMLTMLSRRAGSSGRPPGTGKDVRRCSGGRAATFGRAVTALDDGFGPTFGGAISTGRIAGRGRGLRSCTIADLESLCVVLAY